ncbi:FMN-binding glutamate synthase family protein [Flavihumibacter solisilvae]|uniref:FMN-binding glutamate synthase family protein n=1 Tax=Flavihumibacter solisilvae TaxID=1349421 RepID=UPI00068FA11B|nr:FMN-binding glutamate synthase family protein [Flavihumibacter solisilvae]
MPRNQSAIPVSGSIIFILVLLNGIIIKWAYTQDTRLYLLLLITLPLLLLAISNVRQTKHALLRNYPIIGYFRYVLEAFRPEVRQYFFESESDGKPFNRRQRSIVYQRAKDVRQTVAFGMQVNPNEPGYEWVAHSIYPVRVDESDLRVTIGNHQCSQPYNASVLNIGAMSYGALSKTAIEALNEGARLGGFAHNTGEGGISPYHLKGGHLIWQIGTGYFGCRNAKGNFDADLFSENACRPEVKMIELKLSQGAKPGHGGILPAAKNTVEIATIRNVPVNTTINSPAGHTAFNNAAGMLHFLGSLRELSLGKPVGFKLCIGSRREFHEICYEIRKTDIIPDFIVIDGAEGGTGAAPLEFTDHVGMPLYEALAFASKTLQVYGLKDKVKLIAAGKIISGFDILKVLALGASAVYSARGMMFSLGCIQALKCDSGKCPVGVATQESQLYKGLDITDKKVRVANFHKNTIRATIELMEACGFRNLNDITVSSFFRRLSLSDTQSFEEIYGMKTIQKTAIDHIYN